MTQILDGRTLARTCNKAVKVKVESLARPPGLAVVMVGNDPASAVYVKRKGVVADRLGFVHRQIDLPADTSQAKVEEVVRSLNDDDAIDGILVQLPLPKGLDSAAVVDCVSPDKDVDGLTIRSIGYLAQGRQLLAPCTPWGVMKLLALADVNLSGKSAVVIGRSNMVGRPMAMLLEQANCTVTVCHSRTTNLEEVVRRSDVVVAAIGQPKVVQGSWIKPGALVIDVGINRLDDGSLCGDVDTEAASVNAAAITPVPGGVGPMTIAMLMENTYKASCARQGVSAG
ncbi:MAG: bifunctional methylenetetrahydrofolate dehydrogenase/methenyltetrahydrofolate cyclohydrolase FolD [Rhodobacterales bacterium]|nr:bifunctional methylenetetrahydrofolate dehydrogenase/methenyltetrahydrofolate cyclohydrolase FolD [Rhodobacterales bacterium]